MIEWFSGTMLAAQAAMTIVAVELLRRRVLVHLRRMPQPELVLDVWGPIALVLPMLFFTDRVDQTVRGAGWVAVGGPVICVMLGLGAAMIVAGKNDHGQVDVQSPARSGLLTPATSPMLASWAGVGAILLLLGAAHDLKLLAGQAAFGIAAVLLWINTPEDPQPSDQPSAASHNEAGLGMMLVLLCAIGQGAASLGVAAEHAKVSGAMMVGGAAMGLAAAAAQGGPVAAIRLGGWAAAYGVLMAVGVLTMRHMLPQAIESIRSDVFTVSMCVASGFGAYAIEACLLLTVPAITPMMLRWPMSLRRWSGGAIIAGGAVLAAARLSAI